ncbi:MAG: DUF2147 domain-containing protein [Desulfovibrionaceae bacterium]|jgi:uncharacterized protein (DUF2147 family)|nr:DUF2147 domain-containing protein [Desulfovibrionaceae bacterium]
MKTVRRTLAAAALLSGFAAAAQAQMTPVGTWRTFDDSTGQPKSEVVITENNGVLTGHVEKLLRPGADPNELCTNCPGDRKGKPMVGLEIIRGAKKAGHLNVWEDGYILDPQKGSTYALELTPANDGQQLQVRGSYGPFSRTQTWTRVK